MTTKKLERAAYLPAPATAETLKQFRLEFGLSQAQLARLLDVSAISISSIESGVRVIGQPMTYALALEALRERLVKGRIFGDCI